MSITKRPIARGATIDGPTSKDLDDSIWLIRSGDGWILEVSIADVASAITLGSPMDIRAREMGSTRYFATSNNPMFPRNLSEDSLSLWAGEERMAVTVTIPLSAELEVGKVEIKLTRLVSSAKLHYSLVDQIINGKAPNAFTEMLRDCNVLASALLKKRRNSGALAVYDLIKGFRTTEDGLLVPVSSGNRNLANIIVQEFMILANRVVAEYCIGREIPLLFRNHSPKSIAPDRSSLLEDMRKSVDRPDQFSPETLSQRFSLIFNRATYGPLLEGHFALNLPAYIHFTSPIRRYADLVNHRMLVAALNGSPFPYSPSEMIALGAELTAIDHEIKDRRNESFKTARQNELRRSVAKGSLNRLDGDSFYGVLKLAARGDEMSEELKDEILRRLKAEMLLSRDAYVLLLEASQAIPAWLDIKKGVFEWLTAHLDHTVTIFATAQQIGMTSSPVLSINKTGLDHAAIFTGTGTVEWQGGQIISEEAQSPVKKTTEQVICLSLIHRILEKMGVDIKWQASQAVQMPLLGQVPASGLAATNPKGRLLEICQKYQWPYPTFVPSREGPDHMAIFHVIGTLKVGDTTYRSEVCRAASKKEAEQLAAESLLQQVPQAKQLPAAPAPAVSTPTVPLKVPLQSNFISVLQEWLAVRGIPLPVYEQSQVGPAHQPTFTCVCTVALLDQRKVVGDGKGPNSKVAKQRAAECVYQKLT